MQNHGYILHHIKQTESNIKTLTRKERPSIDAPSPEYSQNKISRNKTKYKMTKQPLENCAGRESHTN